MIVPGPVVKRDDSKQRQRFRVAGRGGAGGREVGRAVVEIVADAVAVYELKPNGVLLDRLGSAQVEAPAEVVFRIIRRDAALILERGVA